MEQPRAGARSPDLPIMVVYDVRDAPRNRVAPRPADRGRGQRAAPDDALPPGRLARAARRRARRNPGGRRGGVGSDGAPVRWAPKRTVLAARPQGRLDVGALPARLRGTEPGPTRNRALAVVGFSGAGRLVPFRGRAGVVRIHFQGLRRAGRPRRGAAYGGVEPGDRERAGPPAAGHGAALVAGDSGGEIHLLLSHGPTARRVGQLVPRVHGQPPAPDADRKSVVYGKSVDLG